jgi:hypothetical protein
MTPSQAPADACPHCHPGIPEPAVALFTGPASGGAGTLTAYQCPACRTTWQTETGSDGWTVARTIIT